MARRGIPLVTVVTTGVFVLSVAWPALATDYPCFTKTLGTNLCGTCVNGAPCTPCDGGSCFGTRTICTPKRRAFSAPTGYSAVSYELEPCFRAYQCEPEFGGFSCDEDNPCVAKTLHSSSSSTAMNHVFSGPGCSTQ